MHTFHHVKKRSLFLIGLLVSGISGVVVNYFTDNYSKDGSLILPTAHADYTNYPTGGTGDGSGGCSDGGSY